MEEELIKIWQSSPNQERIKFEKSRFILDVQSSLEKFHRAIKYRDLREQIGIAIVIPAFTYLAYAIPFLLSKLASVLIIIWAIYIAFRLHDVKRHKPGALYESYLEYLHQTRRYLLLQKQMMSNMMYWYILPGMSLTMLLVLGFSAEQGRSKFIILMAIGNVVLAIVTYFINRWKLRKEYVPRLKKVEELIQMMELP